jgi:hypothetical protein
MSRGLKITRCGFTRGMRSGPNPVKTLKPPGFEHDRLRRYSALIAELLAQRPCEGIHNLIRNGTKRWSTPACGIEQSLIRPSRWRE